MNHWWYLIHSGITTSSFPTIPEHFQSKALGELVNTPRRQPIPTSPTIQQNSMQARLKLFLFTCINFYISITTHSCITITSNKQIQDHMFFSEFSGKKYRYSIWSMTASGKQISNNNAPFLRGWGYQEFSGRHPDHISSHKLKLARQWCYHHQTSRFEDKVRAKEGKAIIQYRSQRIPPHLSLVACWRSNNIQHECRRIGKGSGPSSNMPFSLASYTLQGKRGIEPHLLSGSTSSKTKRID